MICDDFIKAIPHDSCATICASRKHPPHPFGAEAVLFVITNTIFI